MRWHRTKDRDAELGVCCAARHQATCKEREKAFVTNYLYSYHILIASVLAAVKCTHPLAKKAPFDEGLKRSGLVQTGNFHSPSPQATHPTPPYLSRYETHGTLHWVWVSMAIPNLHRLRPQLSRIG
ncbi:hypothetical protein LX32DRAFT_368573 [Colletotrichum zoysiae]|uniref:Uncharacterized protein n=1 Tax=Colletotrichum zoysiae TaxID=1216348 RepID=A0AAD9HSR0_9PEZI|nr:hypothetical protein LX32DRAFT_368573 [Colletotrichum zoysiae]